MFSYVFLQMYMKGFTDNITLMEIEEVVEQQRQLIDREMEDYEYPEGRYGMNIRCLNSISSRSSNKL